MKPVSQKDARELAERTLNFLASEEGKKALSEAADQSKKAAEPFRRTREVASERLNRRFTV